MERWSGKVALVTGASSGIGRAIALALADSGMKVAAVARREDRLQKLAKEVKGGGSVHPLKGDVTNEEDVVRSFKWAESNLGPVQVLVNNAGITIKARVSDCVLKDWEKMYRLNVFGVGLCVREALASMKRHGIDDGHIININSISGHPALHVPGSWVYASTKHAITVLTEGLMRELTEDGSKVKVTSLSPGVVNTEIFEAGGWQGNYESMPALNAEDIASSAIAVLSTPPHVLVTEMTVRPLGEKL